MSKGHYHYHYHHYHHYHHHLNYRATANRLSTVLLFFFFTRWIWNFVADLGGGMISAFRLYSWRGSLCRCLTTSQWNVEGGRQYVAWLAFFFYFLLLVLPFAWIDWVDGMDLAFRVLVGMRVCIHSPTSRLIHEAELTNAQDCGIRNEGSSTECCQLAQQPEPHGSTRLRSRGISFCPIGFMEKNANY